MSCPYCDSPNVSCDEVDIGVGSIPCGPAGCEDCHSFQINPAEIESNPHKFSAEEIKVGWVKGEFLTQVLARNAALDQHFGVNVEQRKPST